MTENHNFRIQKGLDLNIDLQASMSKRSFFTPLLIFTLSVNIAFAEGIKSSKSRIQKIELGINNNPDSNREMALVELNQASSSRQQKLEANYILGELELRNYAFAEAEEYYHAALHLANLNKDTLFLARLHYKIGLIHNHLGENREAREWFQKAEICSTVSGYMLNRIVVLNAVGILESDKGNLYESEEKFKEGILLAQNHQDLTLEWSLRYGLLKPLNGLGKLVECYEEGYKCLSIAERLNDSMLVAKSNLGLGILFYQESKFSKALYHLEQAKITFEKLGDEYWTGIAYINLALTYLDTQGVESSIEYAEKAEAIFSTIRTPGEVLSIRNILSSAYIKKKKYKTAIQYAKENINDFSGKEMSNGLVQSYLNLSRCNLALNKLEKAIASSKAGLNVMISSGATYNATDFYAILVEVYEQLGDAKEGLKYSKLAYTALGKKRDKDLVQKINEIEANFLFRNDKIKKLANEAKYDVLISEEVQEAQARFNVIIGCLVGAFLTTIMLLKMYCSKRTANKELEFHNQSIKEQAKKLKEIDCLKSRFFTNISHEFRTPLTLISGPAEQLQASLDGDDAKKASTIRKNTKRLLKLVNQILELAELESQDRSLKLRKVSIRPFVQQIAGTFETLADSREIDFRCYINAPLPSVHIEQESIEKIIVNLLSNAFKFSSNNSVIILNVQCNSSKLEISVKDNGIGIGEEEKARIFDMFYYTESDQSASSGIGLSLVNALVKSHGGTIDVESEKGEGSKFTITIPTDLEVYPQKEIIYKILNEGITDYNIEEQYDAKAPLDEEENKEDKIVHQDTILVIDDNHEIRNYIHNLLGDKFRILAAKDGHEGYEKAKEFIPDLILCDVMMPKMNGFEFLKEAKADERTSHIPVILLTAKGDKESKIEGLSLKADDYLTKPFDQHELMIRIDNLIRNRKMMQERYSKDLLFNHAEIDGQSSDQVLMDRILMVIEDRIDDSTLSVDELSKEVGLSRSQLHRKIVALTGKSTSIFIRNIRLRMAHEMLKKHLGNISEISDRVGFSSPSYFNRCFKEMYGVPPSVVLNQTDENLTLKK